MSERPEDLIRRSAHTLADAAETDRTKGKKTLSAGLRGPRWLQVCSQCP